MGIRSLFSFIKTNIISFDIYDLAKVGTNESPIEILVDSNWFIRYLIEIISFKMANEYKNNNLLFSSGEYDIFRNAFSEFHSSFKNAGINLVWILDGAKVLVLKCLIIKIQ